MFGLWRLLNLSSRIIRTSRHSARRPLNSFRRLRRPLRLEELEERVVPSLMGQQLFPSDNPWNQNVSSAPLAANSAAIISHIGGTIHLHPDWGADSAANGNSPLYGIPFNVVHGNGMSKVNVIIDNYPGESDIVGVPIPANAVIEGDFQNGPNLNIGSDNRGDSHLIVWDEDTDTAYELYGVTRPTDTVLFPDTNGNVLPHTDTNWHAAQETVWNMKTDTFRTLGATSADAAGLSILAGLVRPDEGLTVAQGGQGAITHALRLTLPRGDINPQYIYPASHVVNDSQGTNNVPFGARLRLQNNATVNNLISQMPPESQIVARAMQQYGLIVADIGSAMYVTGASATVDTVDSPHTDLVWDMNDIFASNGLEVLTSGDFDVVNLQPVVTSLSTSSGSAGMTVTVTGKNFSGAAGHLSVLFGTKPATSVNVLSDTQVTAVVPTGSGTVNVTVQSGVVETDNISSNPNANVTGAIWGYGTSTISTADQFKYITQTVSGTNSSASFAGATDASGTADALTIVVKDTTGNPIVGLSSSLFHFGLAGGTSAGSFGAVSATATPGTYTAAFTGSTAGSASTVTITVNGVTLSAQPAVTVTAGAVNGATSTALFASPTVTAGSTDQVTVVVKDAAGNAVSGLGSSAFAFSLAGSSSGTFGTVTETATAGTYTATFTATVAGTASTLTTRVNGVALTSTPPSVAVTPGPLDLSKSTVAFTASILQTGASTTLTLTARDSAGNALTTGGATVVFALTDNTRSDVLGPVTDNGNGTYTAIFTAGPTAGTNSVTATINSQAVTSTMPTVNMTTLPVSLTGTTLTITGTPGNDTFSFTPGTVQDTIMLNGANLAVNAATVRAVVFQGNGGSDTANVFGSSTAINTLILSPGSGTLSGSAYSVTVNAVNTIWAYGNAADTATLVGSSSGDVFVSSNAATSSSSYAYIRSGSSARWNYAVGFGTVFSHPATSGNGTGMAYEYDQTGHATYTAHPFSGVMSGPGFTYTVTNFRQVIAVGKPGSSDRADLFASASVDEFFAYPAYGVMTDPNVYYNYAFSFAIVDAHASSAGGNKAFFFDNVGGATFTGTPTSGGMITSSSDNRADGFAGVYVYNQTTTQDRRHVTGSPVVDFFSGLWVSF
jgi:hypothetical protein